MLKEGYNPMQQVSESTNVGIMQVVTGPLGLRGPPDLRRAPRLRPRLRQLAASEADAPTQDCQASGRFQSPRCWLKASSLCNQQSAKGCPGK